MIRITFDASGLVKLIHSLNKDSEHFSERMDRTLERIKLRYYQHVMIITPVDTGYMKSRWRNLPVQKKGKVWIGVVQNDTFYLPFVNYGHWTEHRRSFVPGQFFLQKALKMMQTTIQKEMVP